MSKENKTSNKKQNGNDFIADVVSSKRFTDTDMLNAYIRGFKDADIDESGLGYVKTDVIIENGLNWLKEYHKQFIAYNVPRVCVGRIIN